MQKLQAAEKGRITPEASSPLSLSLFHFFLPAGRLAL